MQELEILNVYVTQDCGSSRTLIYTKGGAELQTVYSEEEFLVPSAQQWRNEHVVLDSFAGEQAISFIFETYSNNENTIYLDNLNLRYSESNFDEDLFTVYPIHLRIK